MDMTLAKLWFYVCTELHDDHDQPCKQHFSLKIESIAKENKAGGGNYRFWSIQISYIGAANGWLIVTWRLHTRDQILALVQKQELNRVQRARCRCQYRTLGPVVLQWPKGKGWFEYGKRAYWTRHWAQLYFDCTNHTSFIRPQSGFEGQVEKTAVIYPVKTRIP